MISVSNGGQTIQASISVGQGERASQKDRQMVIRRHMYSVQNLHLESVAVLYRPYTGANCEWGAMTLSGPENVLPVHEDISREPCQLYCRRDK